MSLSTVRAAFFICAIHSWDPSTGLVWRAKAEFYSLDEISNILFFNLASVLALFWAELYYISIDRADIYLCIVRPVAYIVNIIAIVGVVVMSIMIGQYYASDVDYVFSQYAMMITSTYLIAAIMFAYYSYMAAQELEKVPLPMMARRDRLFSLRFLAFITIVALASRGSISIYIDNKSLSTDTTTSMTLVFFYFFCFEIFPIIIILIFYRIDTLLVDENGSKDDNSYSNVDGRVGSRTPRTALPGRTLSGETQPEVFEAIIARLSLETGYPTTHLKSEDQESMPTEKDTLLGNTRSTPSYRNPAI